MAYAVTHILVVIVFLDLLRHYIFKKEKFPRYLVVLGGIAVFFDGKKSSCSWGSYSQLTVCDCSLCSMYISSFQEKSEMVAYIPCTWHRMVIPHFAGLLLWQRIRTNVFLAFFASVAALQSLG